MKHARTDYNRIVDTENKIPEDEPVFLLRAQDVSAAATVRHWADLNDAGGGDPVLSELARNQAVAMDAWTPQKPADL